MNHFRILAFGIAHQRAGSRDPGHFLVTRVTSDLVGDPSRARIDFDPGRSCVTRVSRDSGRS